LAQPPFNYPKDDDTPYLQLFSDRFSSIFVALNPFLKLPGHPAYKNGDPVPDSAIEDAFRLGKTCGVSWQEMAELCGFTSIHQVNRALRLTGSKRISSRYGNESETDHMLKLCAQQSIYPPDEGCSSPLLELAMGAFAQAAGHESLISAGHFGSSPEEVHVADFLDRSKECECVELWTEDRSLYCAIYIDYHYFLICQTDASLRRAEPHLYFEGFYADSQTNDLWGVGDFSGQELPQDGDAIDT
jgi:hypothetical protein